MPVRNELQAETGTCDLPLLINPAKQLLFIKQRYGKVLPAQRIAVLSPVFRLLADW